MRKIVIVFLLCASFSFAQRDKIVKLGKVTISELEMHHYPKDTLAEALVLEEFVNTYLSEKHNLDFRTDYYHRIKLFSEKAYKRATISIELFDKQRGLDIEAYSYHLENGQMIKTKLNKKDIFKKDIDEKWREVVFTIPNLKKGSVIEYKYSIISPYTSIRDWRFQSDIPKLKSDFTFTFLGNYRYNSRLIGYLKLDRDTSFVKRRCLRVPGASMGDCAVFQYGMDSVPAFKEEDFMLSKNNFIARLKVDLISITHTDGRVRKFTKTWKDADKNFKSNFLDGQTNKKRFFERELPEEILAEKSSLKKAKEIYKHIQQRFTWNKKYWSYKNIKVREAYGKKNGGVAAINLSLYNSLQAANIESYIVMAATRQKGIPTKLYPVTQDFNYVLVKVVVEGKTYFLDATEKFLSFGQIPLRCLNGEGRVLDFSKGGYWEQIKPILNNTLKIWAQFNLDEDNELVGKIAVGKRGYYASNSRESITISGEENYLRRLDSRMIDYEIEDYKVTNRNNVEEPFSEQFKLYPDEDVFNANTVRINPFFYHRIQSNPFKLEERNYPVDFGYPRSITYTINIDVPKGYELTKFPEAKAIKLPNRSANLVYRINQDGNKITLNYRYKISKRVFSSEEYYYLKEFYNQLIKLHGSYLEFKKI